MFSTYLKNNALEKSVNASCNYTVFFPRTEEFRIITMSPSVRRIALVVEREGKRVSLLLTHTVGQGATNCRNILGQSLFSNSHNNFLEFRQKEKMVPETSHICRKSSTFPKN